MVYNCLPVVFNGLQLFTNLLQVFTIVYNVLQLFTDCLLIFSQAKT